MDTFVNFVSALFFLSVLLCGVAGCSPPPPGDKGRRPPGGDGTYIAPPKPGIPDRPEGNIHIRSARSIPSNAEQRISTQYMFSVLDDDMNGVIDACEYLHGGLTDNVRKFVEILDIVDSNHDNVLSASEFEKLKAGWRYQELNKGDTADTEEVKEE